MCRATLGAKSPSLLWLWSGPARRGGDRERRYCGSHQGTAGPSAVHAACGGPGVRLRSAHQGTGGAHAGVRWGRGAPTARRAGRTGGPSRCQVRGAGDGGRIEGRGRRAPIGAYRQGPPGGRDGGSEAGGGGRGAGAAQYAAWAQASPLLSSLRRPGTVRARLPPTAPPRGPQDDAGLSPNVFRIWRQFHCFGVCLPYLSCKRPFKGAEQRRLYARPALAHRRRAAKQHVLTPAADSARNVAAASVADRAGSVGQVHSRP